MKKSSNGCVHTHRLGRGITQTFILISRNTSSSLYAFILHEYLYFLIAVHDAQCIYSSFVALFFFSCLSSPFVWHTSFFLWISNYRLELVTGALQKYRNVVRQKNVIKYDPIYPIISNFLESVYKKLWNDNELEQCECSKFE